MQNLLEIFTETTVRATKSKSKTAWQYETPRKKPIGSDYQRCFGKQLKDIALRGALLSLDSFTPESLQGIPWYLVEDLWLAIMKLGLNSFNNWRNFATHYGDIIEEGLRFHVSEIPRPYQSLTHYLSGAIPLSSEWVTFVTICNLQVCRSDVDLLGKFPNLGVLEFVKYRYTEADAIVGGFEPDDAIIRSWSRAAKSDGAFSKLRVLGIRNHPKVTGLCLPWLSAFPSLYTFAICGSSMTGMNFLNVHRLGWQAVSLNSTIEERYEKSTWQVISHEPVTKERYERSGLSMGRGLAYQRHQYIGAGMSCRDITQGLEDEVMADDGKPVHMFRIGCGADSMRDRSYGDVVFERIAWLDDPEESNSQSNGTLTRKRPDPSADQLEQEKRPKVEKKPPSIKESKKKDVADLLSFIDGSVNP